MLTHHTPFRADVFAELNSVGLPRGADVSKRLSFSGASQPGPNAGKEGNADDFDDDSDDDMIGKRNMQACSQKKVA